MNWEQWIAANRKQIEHIAGYEENFVRTILSKIPEIEPEDVTAQFHFKDSSGGNRYIDFMISNDQKGYQLPIELDGYWKVNNYNDFNDMLERQNDLVAIYGVLLRFTNNKMNHEPDKVVAEIRRTLELQSKNQLSQKIIQTKTQQRVDEYQQELDQLKAELKKQKANNNQSSSTITGSEIASIQAAIAELQANINQNNNSNSEQVTSETITTATHQQQPAKTKITANQMFIAGCAGLVIVTLGANAFFNKNNDNTSTLSNDEPLSLVQVEDNDLNGIDNNVQASKDSDSLETNSSVSLVQNSDTSKKTIEDSKAETVLEDNSPPAVPEVKREVEKVDVYQPASNEPQNKQSYEEAVSSTVPAAQAYKHIGDYRVVCGNVVQVKGFSKGKYLNLGSSYPNQDATIVVWNSDMGNFDSVDQYEGREICVEGTVSSYKGTPQIKLSSMNQLK